MPSPEVQNRGISDPIKRHVSTKIFFLKKKIGQCFAEHKKGEGKSYIPTPSVNGGQGKDAPTDGRFPVLACAATSCPCNLFSSVHSTGQVGRIFICANWDDVLYPRWNVLWRFHLHKLCRCKGNDWTDELHRCSRVENMITFLDTWHPASQIPVDGSSISKGPFFLKYQYFLQKEFMAVMILTTRHFKLEKTGKLREQRLFSNMQWSIHTCH